MPVVGEVDDLVFLGDFRKDFESGPSAVVGEIDQDIVEDQRHRLVVFDMMFQAGQAEGEVELIAGSLAHSFDRNFGVVGAQADENLFVFVGEIGSEAAERAECEAGKDFAGSSQNAVLMFFAVAFDFMK